MARFSDLFSQAQTRIEALTEVQEPLRTLPSILETAEKQGGLSVEDAASLLAWGHDPSRRKEILAAAKQVRQRVAGKTVEFIIPVYLTSFCRNDCLYCGYRKSNPLAERVRLSLEDLGRELDLILSWGHRQIELVLSDDAELGADKLVSYVELTRQKLEAVGGGVVAVCSPVYEEADYHRLRAAGLHWVVEWQETYHQPHFDRWHFSGSPKRHYQFRLDLWDRTIAAGLTRFGMGVLLGLYAWPFDVLAVIEHGNYLRQTYGLHPHAIGIPRLKAARGVLATQRPSRFTVSDEDYRFIVSIYHLAFPRSRLFFNTREDYQFNLSMVAGGDLFTVDCETLPGGYSRGHLPGQFSTHSYPPRREVVAALEQRGFSCRYLAEERETPQTPSRSRRAGLDVERWAREHEQIRARTRDFELELSRSVATPPAERQAAAAVLRTILEFFSTVVIEHCRNTETFLSPALEQDARHDLRAYHERFGVDLDKFERQIASYELSGDPTVLGMLGNRILREFREHLGAEEELLGDWSGAASLSPGRKMRT